MRQILADKNKSVTGRITRITRRFDDVTSSKISRYLDHTIKLDGKGANPRTSIDQARKILKDVDDGKPSDTIVLGEMKYISKGVYIVFLSLSLSTYVHTHTHTHTQACSEIKQREEESQSREMVHFFAFI